jgi:hypothetical protein
MNPALIVSAAVALAVAAYYFATSTKKEEPEVKKEKTEGIQTNFEPPKTIQLSGGQQCQGQSPDFKLGRKDPLVVQLNLSLLSKARDLFMKEGYEIIFERKMDEHGGKRNSLRPLLTKNEVKVGERIAKEEWTFLENLFTLADQVSTKTKESFFSEQTQFFTLKIFGKTGLKRCEVEEITNS